MSMAAVVVLDGKAYETVQGTSQPVQVPPTATLEPTRKPSVSATPEPTRRPGSGATPTALVTSNSPVATPTPENRPASGGLCGGAAALVMGMAAVVVLTRRKGH